MAIKESQPLWQDILSKKFIRVSFLGSPTTAGDFEDAGRPKIAPPRPVARPPRYRSHQRRAPKYRRHPSQTEIHSFRLQAVEWNCLWIGIGAFFFEQVDCNSGAFLTEISKDFTPIWVLVSPWQFRKASTRSSISQGWSNQKFHELPTKHV